MKLTHKQINKTKKLLLCLFDRNINVPALNDSYYVGLSIYNVVLCSVVATPLSLLITQNLNVTYALVAGFELFCTTSTLMMLFFPKVSKR